MEEKMSAVAAATGPDFRLGVRLADIPPSGTLPGRVGDEAVLLSRFGSELAAVGGICTHYGAMLADGLIEGEAVRCPLHHACFSLRTGAALSAPAFAGLDRWKVEMKGGRAFVRERQGPAGAVATAAPAGIGSVVLVGGGGAAFACAETLRRLGYRGRLTMVSAEADAPCDRPNLSKDYLAGTAPEEWIPLRGEDHYREAAIDLRLNVEIVAIDTLRRVAVAGDGEQFPYDRLLLATGAEPVRLPGFDQDRVHTLRTLADARAIVARAAKGARAVVIGSSFIGLEAAAALRARGVEVDIVSLDRIPFERIFGAQVGLFLQRLHERNGVRFHLGRTAARLGDRLVLDDGGTVEADFAILGVGVRPRVGLAESAGIAVGDGILVDPFLETDAAGVYAAGDAAAYPDPLSGRPMRIEHWVAAQRQGQTAAANMLGARARFGAIPFFWTEHYGTALRYVGRAPGWDEVRIDGDIEAGAFTARYFEEGILRASASVGRDRDNLDDELRLERLVAEAARPRAQDAGTLAPLCHPM
jgi:NADPH-dependent 2,4-dienoyl-CoA reductase/sulfur reductase-like enzyme/nitrite reductase/ring-hydroxylating ferredoxin subunit